MKLDVKLETKLKTIVKSYGIDEVLRYLCNNYHIEFINFIETQLNKDDVGYYR